MSVFSCRCVSLAIVSGTVPDWLHCEALLQRCCLSKLFITLFISDWNFKFVCPITCHPFLFLDHVWLTCAAGFTHSTCDDMLRVNCIFNVPLILCVRFTLGISLCDPFYSCAPYAACAIAFAFTPYDDCNPFHSCVPYAACSMYVLFTLYGACALHTFFQLFQMIWHCKFDFPLLLVLVMSLFPYTLYCTFLLLHTNMSNCFQNVAFTGEK